MSGAKSEKNPHPRIEMPKKYGESSVEFHMGVEPKNRGVFKTPPQIIPFVHRVGVSIIFTIHFGCFSPIFGSTPISKNVLIKKKKLQGELYGSLLMMVFWDFFRDFQLQNLSLPFAAPARYLQDHPTT